MRNEGEGVVDELADAWRSDPRCVECGRTVAAVSEAALLVGPNRVTHRDGCFIPALLRANPHLRMLAARPIAQEEDHGSGAAVRLSTPPGSVNLARGRAEARLGG